VTANPGDEPPASDPPANSANDPDSYPDSTAHDPDRHRPRQAQTLKEHDLDSSNQTKTVQPSNDNDDGGG
jgi:hypothetical protein